MGFLYSSLFVGCYEVKRPWEKLEIVFTEHEIWGLKSRAHKKAACVQIYRHQIGAHNFLGSDVGGKKST